MPNFSCIPNIGYFDSPEFLKLSLHTVSTISTPIYFLGIYCILLKTPDEMKSVKWNLFALHMWITIFDYSVSLLTVPFLLIPEVAGIPYGVLRDLGVPTSIQTVSTIIVLIFMLISILSVYENRFFILCELQFKEKWVRGRRIWLFLHYFLFFAGSQVLFYYIPDQETAKQTIFKNLPCLPDYVYNGPVFVLFTDYFYIKTHILLIMPIFILQFVFFISQIVKSGNEQKQSLSQKTYQMHKRFLIALFIQITVPICMLSVPLIYGSFTFFYNYYNRAAMNFSVIIFTTHGFVSTTVMVLVHYPYRQAVSELIRSVKLARRKSTIVSVNFY